jgi:hypothetical protein
VTRPPTTYHVFAGDLLVLEVRDEPGILISVTAAPPPPGTPPTMHPFLTAAAYVPEHEGILGDALDRSTSFDQFIAELVALGYRVVPQSSELGS